MRALIIFSGSLLIAFLQLQADDATEVTGVPASSDMEWIMIQGKLVKTRKTADATIPTSQANVQGSANVQIEPKTAKTADKPDYKIEWVYENGELVKKKIPLKSSVVVKRDTMMDVPIERDERTKRVFFDSPTVLDDNLVRDNYTGKLSELKLKSKSQKK